MALLEIQLNGRLRERITLDEQQLTIGRDPDNRLNLGGPRTAPHHAVIIASPEGYLLIDLGSPGTLLNGTTVQANQPYQLEDGALIQIGVHTLLFRAAAQEPAAAEPLPQVGDLLIDPEQIAQLFAPLIEPALPQPIPLAERGASRYLYDLPTVYHEQELLGRFLQIFEQIWEPLEQRQDHIDRYFDPRTAPASFVPWLASWFPLPLQPNLSAYRQRQLAAEAFRLQRWRGTASGLAELIELHTGFIAQISDMPDRPFVFHIQIWMPRDRQAEQPTVEALIKQHKPVFAGYVLEYSLIDPPSQHAMEQQP
jgi:phage tail-like protein